MSKRSADDYLNDDSIPSAVTKPKQPRRFKEKHSLDSDEEDVPDDYKVMDKEDIEGEEDATIEDDEGIKITPFNMKEEMEEGHFDTGGYYHWKKDDNDIRDGWVENIDWVKVRREQRKPTKAGGDDKDDSDSSDDVRPLDSNKQVQNYNEMLKVMLPGESVNKALRRLGGGAKNRGNASARWCKQKKGDAEKEAAAASDVDRENLEKLTGLADRLLVWGEYNIYQATYEKLHYNVQKNDRKFDDKTDDDILDMFGEDVDGNEKLCEGGREQREKAGTSNSAGNVQPQASVTRGEASEPDPDGPVDPSITDEVCWEFKWEESDDATIYGPHSSSQMLRWTQSDYFPNGCFVRKLGSEAKFRSSSRIDFELYT
ncbi:PREDICTED: CD2 antigen cytoplasmic tail-binding protein 2 homolog [Priapulus caudatus]|uniref:CD2 antigen cytoplasmic tail-binding protein 2 homolog n=1 Tax=Priapulus caudatus TaxID=37621 RepID=A0ABM1ENT0_PRICU|nr:PREDICTED: CD2 antigen cytoplasmic tail-binding protein 2 homolog [Priapulus caudatus]